MTILNWLKQNFICKIIQHDKTAFIHAEPLSMGRQSTMSIGRCKRCKIFMGTMSGFHTVALSQKRIDSIFNDPTFKFNQEEKDKLLGLNHTSVK